MKLAVTFILVGLAVFVIRGPDEHQIHTLAWVLGVIDAVLVAWTLLPSGGN